jgi:hypothetical protein
MREGARVQTRAIGLRAAVVVAGALMLASAPAARTRAVEDRQVHVLPLPPSAALSLAISNGKITITGRPRPDVRIEIVRRAPDAAALARLPVDISTLDDALRLSIRQPGGATDAELVSDVVLEVPTAARVESVDIGEGALELRDLRGRITAVVRHGPITATQISGTIRLETNIGDVELKAARLAPGGLLRLRTFNGDVRVSLVERPADARILALALNGTIRSAIPLTVKDAWGPRWAEATLGKGEPVMSIDVVNGAIVIDAPGSAR